MRKVLALGVILLFVGLAIADEPRIENITITPEKPVSLSLAFTQTVRRDSQYKVL